MAPGDDDDLVFDPDKEEPIETRCQDCINMCIECPEGYYSGNAYCAICSHQIVLVKPMCADNPECPECTGPMILDRDCDEDEDDEEWQV